MANKKISELPNANLPITTGVKFEAVQAGINVQVDADDMPGSGGGTWGSITGTLSNQADLQAALDAKAPLAGSKVIQVACSDETSALTAGTQKVTFRMPYAMTLTAIRISLVGTQTAGSIFTVDVNEGGTTILSTKLTIDNNEKTSTTAATPVVISDSALADDAEITVDIDQVGNGTATGLKLTLIGS